MSAGDEPLPLPVKMMNIFVLLLLIVIFHAFYLFFVNVAFGPMPMSEFQEYLLEHNLLTTIGKMLEAGWNGLRGQ